MLEGRTGEVGVRRVRWWRGWRRAATFWHDETYACPAVPTEVMVVAAAGWEGLGNIKALFVCFSLEPIEGQESRCVWMKGPTENSGRLFFFFFTGSLVNVKCIGLQGHLATASDHRLLGLFIASAPWLCVCACGSAWAIKWGGSRREWGLVIEETMEKGVSH